MARNKQGTITFFLEIIPLTKKLSDEQFGILMRAAFAYRVDRTVYSGDDLAVDMAFQFIANQIDRYLENAEINAQNAGGKRGKRKKTESSEIQQNAEEQAESNEIQQSQGCERGEKQNPPPYPSPYPSPCPSPCPSPYPNPNPITNIVVAADISNAAANRKLKLLNGELGKGVIALTDEQIDDLLNKLGLEMFDYYVDKLSTFIIKNDAKVKNHYETILKWWAEDSVAG